MKVLPLLLAFIVLLGTTVFEGECWFSRRRSGGSTSRSSSRYVSRSPRGRKITVPVVRKTVYVGKTGIRDRDSTGHRTGLGTLARSFVRNPVKTVKAIGAFGKHYRAMKKANIKGGNLNAHDKANYDATKIAGKKVASAISALREQYKRFRAKSNPGGTVHVGDTRTQKETKDTMDANKRGRDRAQG